MPPCASTMVGRARLGRTLEASMVKLQYLLRAPAGESVKRFRDRALASGARLLASGPAQLKLTYTAEEPPRLSVVPFRRDRVALISLWDEAAPEVAVARWNALLQAEGAVAGYRVDESVPRAYRRNWPDGGDTPGGSMLTLLHRRPGMTDPEFLRRWHDGHSHLALEVHRVELRAQRHRGPRLVWVPAALRHRRGAVPHPQRVSTQRDFRGGQDGSRHVPCAQRCPRLPGFCRARELTWFRNAVAGLTLNVPRRSVSASVPCPLPALQRLRRGGRVPQ